MTGRSRARAHARFAAARLPLLVRLRARLRRADDAAAVDLVAAVAERLSVLLAAGVAAPAAWRRLAEEQAVGAVATSAALPTRSRASVAVTARAGLAAAATAAREGEPIAHALDAGLAGDEAVVSRHGGAAPPTAAERGAWGSLAAAWAVASDSGAPLAAALRELAGAMRDQGQLEREVRGALAGPAASGRLVTMLPLVAMAFGAAFGFDTLGVLVADPLGLACLVGGLLLLWAGRGWNRSLARRAAAGTGDRGLELELLAIALSGGTSLDRARRVVTGALTRHLPDVERLADAEVDAIVGLAAEAGAPVAALLRAEAVRQRRIVRSAGLARAAALGVRLMAPLGICVLPAFILLGVLPLVISVVSGTLGGAA